jgi:hypothetical protein
MTACPKPEPRCLRDAAQKRQDELAWRALKSRVTKRDLKRCRVCLKAGASHHHIIPKSLGGRDTDSNVILLCDGPKSCHRYRHSGLLRITGNAMEQVSVWFDERIRPGSNDLVYLR